MEGEGNSSGKKKKDNAKKEPEQKTKEPSKDNSGGNKTSAELPKDAKVIRMPLLSDTMTEGKIVQWNKKVGDKVKSDDSIAEVETDKATMDVVGYEEGTLLYIGVEAGQAAKVNDIIAIVGKPGTDVSAYVNAQKNKSADTSETKPEQKNDSRKFPEALLDKMRQRLKVLILIPGMEE